MKLSIDKLRKLIPEWNNKIIELIPINGGITNINYKVIVEKQIFFLSIPSSNSESLNIDYENKYYNNKICGEINISPRVIKFVKSENLLITEFIESKNSSLKTFQSAVKIKKLVQNIKLIHQNKPFLRNFNMFSQINFYHNILKKDYFSLKIVKYIDKIKKLEQKLYEQNKIIVPCHNDLIPENILHKDNQIFIIDFDYSGNNDPCFELGNLSVEMEYDNDQINTVVKSYYGQLNDNIISRLNLHGIISDIGWSLWSHVQAKKSNSNFDYSAHAIYRLERAMNKIDSKEYELWIKYI